VIGDRLVETLDQPSRRRVLIGVGEKRLIALLARVNRSEPLLDFGFLRSRLAKSGVAVVTIKPGFVDTPMTASIRKGLLFASSRKVGEGIYHAMLKGKEVVYLPWFWRPIMFVLRQLPSGIMSRLDI